MVKDVSDETVAAIMENQYDISGVDIKQDTIRVYEGGEACSSILGYTGTISSEELKERDDSKLTINSIVGKSGMEQYLDPVSYTHLDVYKRQEVKKPFPKEEELKDKLERLSELNALLNMDAKKPATALHTCLLYTSWQSEMYLLVPIR